MGSVDRGCPKTVTTTAAVRRFTDGPFTRRCVVVCVRDGAAFGRVEPRVRLGSSESRRTVVFDCRRIRGQQRRLRKFVFCRGFHETIILARHEGCGRARETARGLEKKQGEGVKTTVHSLVTDRKRETRAVRNTRKSEIDEGRPRWPGRF